MLRALVKLVLIIGVIASGSRAVRAAPATAESLFTEGQAAYDRTDYAMAIAKWQTAYDLSQESGLIFNIAQALRLAGNCEGALAAYKRFITANPGSPQRPLAEILTRELTSTCKGDEPPRVLPALVKELPIRSEPRPRRALLLSGVLLGSSGIALLTTGLLLGRSAQGLGSAVTEACHVDCDWKVWTSTDADGRRRAAMSHWLIVGGGVGIAGGLALYFLGIRTVTAEQHGRGAMVTWSRGW